MHHNFPLELLFHGIFYCILKSFEVVVWREVLRLTCFVITFDILLFKALFQCERAKLIIQIDSFNLTNQKRFSCDVMFDFPVE